MDKNWLDRDISKIPLYAKVFKTGKSRKIICKLGFHVPVKCMVTKELFLVSCQECGEDLTPEDWDRFWKRAYAKG